MLGILIAIAIFLIIGLVVYRIFSAAFKILFYLWIGLFVVLAIIGIIIFFDVQSFKADFPKSEKLVILDYGGTIKAAFAGKQNLESVSKSQLEFYQPLFLNKSFEKLLGDKYKLIIVNKKAIYSLANESFTMQGRNSELKGLDLISVIESNSAKSRLASLFNVPTSAFPDDVTDEAVKGQMFQLLFIRLFQSPTGSLENIRNGNIFIYPESISFKAMKLTNVPLLELGVEKK